MSRKAKAIPLTDAERQELTRISNRRNEAHQYVTRAKIVLLCSEGWQIKDISKQLSETEVTVRKWRDRYLKNGLAGLTDLPRSGAPVTYGADFRKLVLDTLGTPPPDGLARWDGPALAKALSTSVHAVWRLLRKEGICLARMRTWCVSTDPEFAAKAADIVGLYLAAPTKALVISVDEKPNIQALSRTTGYVVTRDGRTVRGLKSTYRRNGTLNLFAALQVAQGTVFAKPTKTKTRVDFLAFMDDLLADISVSDDTEIHVIVDNYCIHKHCTDWLARHPFVHFHFTPTSASWLNQIEIWFGILTRKVLRGASFDGVDQLAKAIESFLKSYNITAKPFVWRKREVKGSQIRDIVSNLC